MSHNKSLNWLEYIKTITNSINTLKNETSRITDHHIKKTGKWNPNLQILHIIEECMEIRKAWKNNDIENEREEYIDLLMSVMTLYHLEELTDAEVKNSVIRVLNKFVERGWLNPKGNS